MVVVWWSEGKFWKTLPVPTKNTREITEIHSFGDHKGDERYLIFEITGPRYLSTLAVEEESRERTTTTFEGAKQPIEKNETKTMVKQEVPQDEGEAERMRLNLVAKFTQTVIDITGLSRYDMDLILAQGIKSVEDLSLFKDKDIDHLFQTPGLKTVPLMTQLKLKGLAEVLRVRRGRGRLHLNITQLDVDLKLRERSRREAYHW